LRDQRRDVPARQQTLRQTFDWSYGLLAPAERELLAVLGVFAGGFTPRAVEAVDPFNRSQADVLAGLEALHDSGLVERVEVPGDDLRFRLLETVREYALARLVEGGLVDAVRRRHAEFYLRLAWQGRPELIGARQREWLNRLDAERDNFRAVLEWAQGDPTHAEIALGLVGALGLFWYIRGYWEEGQQWIAEAFALAGADGPSEARAHALWAAGAIAWRQGDFDRAESSTSSSLELWQALHDKQRMAECYDILGLTAMGRGDGVAARCREERCLALFQETGDRWGCAQALLCLGIVCCHHGDSAEGGAFLAESLSEMRAVHDEWGVALSLLYLGNLALQQADHALGRPRLEEAAGLFRSMRDRGALAWTLLGLALSERLRGDEAQARAYLDEALAWARSVGNQERVAGTVRLLGGPDLEAARAAFPYFRF